MKILKYLGGFILLLIIFVVIMGLIAPTDFHVERSVQIEVPKKVAYDQVTHYKHFQEWSPWTLLDPNMKIEITGDDGQVGAMYLWEGNEDVGKGSMEVIELTDDMIKHKITFLEPMEDEGIGTFTVAEEGTGSKVTWGMDGSMAFPMNGIFMLMGMDMDDMIGKDFDKGLNRLKERCESLPKPEDKSKRASPPATASAMMGDASLTINYSQPSVKGRAIWGELVPFDEVWRTGANEATTIEVDKDVKVNGTTLPAGKYALFTIPGEKDWTVIINKEHDQWGAFNYNQDQDIMRFKVNPESTDDVTERMTFMIGDDGKVSLVWEKLKISFEVKPTA